MASERGGHEFQSYPSALTADGSRPRTFQESMTALTWLAIMKKPVATATEIPNINTEQLLQAAPQPKINPDNPQQ